MPKVRYQPPRPSNHLFLDTEQVAHFQARLEEEAGLKAPDLTRVTFHLDNETLELVDQFADMTHASRAAVLRFGFRSWLYQTGEIVPDDQLDLFEQYGPGAYKEMAERRAHHQEEEREREAEAAEYERYHGGESR